MTERQAQYIAKHVAKLILPKMKRMVNEAVKSTVKDLVYESVVANKKENKHQINEEVDTDDWDLEEEPVVINGNGKSKVNGEKYYNENDFKNAVNRGKQKASDIMKQHGWDVNDMSNQMILDTEVPEMTNDMVDSNMLREAGSIKASQVGKDDNIDPANIDYSEMLEDI